MKPIKSHLLLLSCALAVTLCVGVLYAYMLNTVNTSAKQAMAAARVVKSQQLSNLEQNNTRKIFDETASSRARLKTFFVYDNAAVRFIESLEDLGRQSGSSINIADVVADDNSTGKLANPKIKGKVNVQGSWQNIMRALMLAEVLPFQAKIENVNIGLIESGGKTGNVWNVSFDVVAPLMHVDTKK